LFEAFGPFQHTTGRSSDDLGKDICKIVETKVEEKNDQIIQELNKRYRDTGKGVDLALDVQHSTPQKAGKRAQHATCQILFDATTKHQQILDLQL